MREVECMNDIKKYKEKKLDCQEKLFLINIKFHYERWKNGKLGGEHHQNMFQGC